MGIDEIKNGDLIITAIKVLEEIQNRPSLCQYLTEFTYDRESDLYLKDYEGDKVFDYDIEIFKKYTKSKMYKINENKEDVL